MSKNKNLKQLYVQHLIKIIYKKIVNNYLYIFFKVLISISDKLS